MMKSHSYSYVILPSSLHTPFQAHHSCISGPTQAGCLLPPPINSVLDYDSGEDADHEEDGVDEEGGVGCSSNSSDGAAAGDRASGGGGEVADEKRPPDYMLFELVDKFGEKEALKAVALKNKSWPSYLLERLDARRRNTLTAVWVSEKAKYLFFDGMGRGWDPAGGGSVMLSSFPSLEGGHGACSASAVGESDADSTSGDDTDSKYWELDVGDLPMEMPECFDELGEKWGWGGGRALSEAELSRRYHPDYSSPSTGAATTSSFTTASSSSCPSFFPPPFLRREGNALMNLGGEG
jgi:hypothetical protein